MESKNLLQWTVPYTNWQPMVNWVQTQEQEIEQKLKTDDLDEAREVIARIMAL